MLSEKVTLANTDSVDLDETPQTSASYRGLHNLHSFKQYSIFLKFRYQVVFNNFCSGTNFIKENHDKISERTHLSILG